MNIQLKILTATVIALLCWESVASAHPGGHAHESTQDSQGSRTWTIAAEGTHLHGTFVSAKEGIVQIRRDNGLLSTLTISRLTVADQTWITDRQAEITQINKTPGIQFVAQNKRPTVENKTLQDKQAPAILQHFKPFEKSLELSWNDKYLLVGSKGIPEHSMMIGIRAWQQQVPIPQKYFGDNAWQIPLEPVPAKEPQTAKNKFLRGAIALAINGVPIFNPLNNRGDDAFLFGELDEYGGHCGRADDYHYHLAPVHLEKISGKNNPIAYALDGYPIYSYQDETSPDFAPLDWLNGHKDKHGNYHYHATKNYPYLNGGFYGVVTERDGQVDPQPRAEPLRAALPPLRDAKIIDFKELKPGTFQLTYNVQGKLGTVTYSLAENGSAKFIFVDINGNTKSESYFPNKRGPGGNDRPPPPPPKNDRPAPKKDNSTSQKSDNKLPRLQLSSESINERGFISIDCTCDGTAQSPAIAWKDVPAGTKSFAISLWHVAPDQEKSYLLVYNIPENTTELKQNALNVGKLGLNDKRRAEYDPMCSKGPGAKKYHISVYALSSELTLAPDKATRSNLLNAIKDITLAEGTLDFQYERKK